MLAIFVTLAVLKWLTSSEVSEEQYANIASIFVTSEVLRFAKPSIVVRFERLLNQLLVLVGRASTIEELITAFVIVSRVASGTLRIPSSVVQAVSTP